MLKKILIALLFVVILLPIGGYLYLSNQKPSYNGNQQLPGLENTVEVYFDEFAVPHIYAENDIDAMKALGYIHASERLWQMELVSRIAAGRLSEMFGEKLIDVDKFYLSLGIDKNSREIVNKIDKTTPYYQQTMAYLSGVNEFVKNGKTPVEFKILGLEKDAFTLLDVYNIFGYMAYGFAMGNQTDPLLTALHEKLGDDYINSIGVDIDFSTTLIKSFPEKNTIDEKVAYAKIMKSLKDYAPAASFMGSNSWVLAPEKTKNKKVIFSNDPHIGYSQPAVWYQAHIHTPETEIYGFYLAMTPFPLLGHNHHIAYGLTMLENDDLDLYAESLHPDDSLKYKYGDEYLPFQTYDVQIPVKDEETINYTIKESIHGPIMNGVVPQIKTEQAIAMYWVYTQRPNQLLEAVYRMSRATNIEEFKKGVKLIHAPGLNVMYGDVDDNVAWWASGNLYHRENNAPTKLILDGSDPSNSKIIYTPFEENPQAINPSWHYVYSCNNQPDTTISKRIVPGYYLPQDRANRVVSLLESKEIWDVAETKKMVLDNTSNVTVELNKILVKNLQDKDLNETEKQALQQLTDWQGEASFNSIGISIFTQFKYEYLKATLEDEMGPEIFEEILHTFTIKRLFEPLMKGQYPIWSDKVNTKEVVETNTDNQLTAFKKAVQTLVNQYGADVDQWQWQRLHKIEHPHALGQVKALRPLFNVGPFPVDGTGEVLNNQDFDLVPNAEYKVGHGPSTRRIIDFSDVEHAYAILPTGQSGHALTPHYNDQAQLFLAGDYVPMLLNEKEIKQLKNKLVFKP